MSIPSDHFVLAALILSGVIFALPRIWFRQILLAGFSLAFLASQKLNRTSWITLAAFVLSGFVVGEILRRQANAKLRTALMLGYVFALVAVFAVLKEYQFLSLLIPHGTISRWISIVGLSYMLFRQIHYVVDVAQGQIESTNLWTYLNYQLNAFGLLAGPIARYQTFAADWDALAPKLKDTHEHLKSVSRLMLGVLKVMVVGNYAYQAYNLGCSQPIVFTHLHDWAMFALVFYGFPVYLYFNFSGYCDVVIALASMVGITMPENFNQPYLARNVIDYWNRWHMTLTHWIRDYIFTPLYKAGVERQIMPQQLLGYICLFLALFLAGVWHGSGWGFVIFGVLHGTGIAASKMWEDRLIRERGRPGFREYMKSGKIRIFSIFLTMNFVCFAMLFFTSDLKTRADFLYHFASGKSIFSP